MWAARPHLGSIFEKLLHRKTFQLPVARILQSSLNILFLMCVMFHMKQLYYPNIDQTPCTNAHSPNPHNVGNIIATPVHFQLCVSFRMVRQVVEHGK